MSKQWNKEEIKFLKDNYKDMSYKEIAIKLNRTENAIKVKTNKLGLIKSKYIYNKDYFKVIDSEEKAYSIKNRIKECYPNEEYATVLELLNHEDDLIREYAEFLFDKDYSLYTAKQWGVPPNEIDPSVLKRVPIRFSYDIGYFDDEYQVMPKESYVSFFEEVLRHKTLISF